MILWELMPVYLHRLGGLTSVGLGGLTVLLFLYLLLLPKLSGRHLEVRLRTTSGPDTLAEVLSCDDSIRSGRIPNNCALLFLYVHSLIPYCFNLQ